MTAGDVSTRVAARARRVGLDEERAELLLRCDQLGQALRHAQADVISLRECCVSNCTQMVTAGAS